MKTHTYHETQDRNNYKKLQRILQSELPDFCRTYFRAVEPRTQMRTRLAYAYDLHIFFHFLQTEKKELPGILKPFDKMSSPLLLDQVSARDIEEYLEYLKYRPDVQEREVINQASGIKRKLSSLKSFYNYFYETEQIKTNPAAFVKLPKLHEKEIIRLDYNEVAELLDEVESGASLTKRQKEFHKLTRVRDLALISLLLGTGMRISECVGIDLNDIDMEETAVRIHRKGGKEETIYFSDEVAKTLSNYLAMRKQTLPVRGSEQAFFLSLQNKRLSVRSAENLVKKYAQLVTPLKHITPHKLRSTYGTHLYQETGDIYLVADVLGHTDVNTTKKHYAAIDESQRRNARSIVKLREV